MIPSSFYRVRLSLPKYLAQGARVVPDNNFLEYELEDVQVGIPLEINVEEILNRLVQSSSRVDH